MSFTAPPDAPGQSVNLLLEIADYLERERVPYLVIGALAAAIHGVIRSTLDADALVSLPVTALANIGQHFAGAGYDTELRQGDADDPIPALLVIRDVHANRVDLLGGLRGLEAGVFSRAVAVPFRNRSLKLASGEDLVAMKCFAGGPQDLLDAQQLLRFADPAMDIDLLRRLARRFGRTAADHLEQILSTASRTR